MPVTVFLCDTDLRLMVRTELSLEHKIDEIRLQQEHGRQATLSTTLTYNWLLIQVIAW